MNSNTAIYLLRHGETDWNVQGRRQGHLDSPLTERGEFQAKKKRNAVAEANVSRQRSRVFCKSAWASTANGFDNG
ncbi:histidine phosphatase family protein [uncultured Ruegeria sp.]|uniref:histidine phosphatase family protein n=1 Tax=uncultured Ruegeria sp. TaxID=259304 RepID=UPI0034549F68